MVAGPGEILVGDEQCFGTVCKVFMIIGRVGCVSVQPGIIAFLVHIFSEVGGFFSVVCVGVNVMMLTIRVVVGVVLIVFISVGWYLLISAQGFLC